MPEPISSSSTSPIASTAYDDPTLDEQGLVCRAEAPSSTPSQANTSVAPAPAQPAAVRALVDAVPTAPSTLPPPSKPAVASTANNNAERTSERPGISPYAAAGWAGDTYSLFAGAALLKGQDETTGLDVEVLSASGQVGTEEEWQAALLRAGKSTSSGSLNVEAMTLRLNRGIHNDDGSVGFNMGGQATALGAEGTLGTVDSITGGLSLGAGGAVSAGVRDLDGDGNHELCAKISIGPVTLGACVETSL